MPNKPISNVLMSLFLTFLLLITHARAQEVSGHLEGRVVDAQGAPLTDANITVAGPSLLGKRGATTDARGYFRVLALPVGSHGVQISHVGFGTARFEDVSVRLGKTTSLVEIRLGEEALGMSEVIVSGTRPSIDPVSTSLGANMAEGEYALLPVERNSRTITALLPHANTSYLGDEVNFAGATGLENKYFIDGVDATDPFRGTTGTNLPYNFIREIQIRTGGYEAEYRSSLGGIVNVVTHSGGNEFHGQVFGFFANDAFAGDQRRGAYEPDEGDFSQRDIGFKLGGPIVRDRLWFSTAYNPTFESEEVDVPGIGFFKDRRTTHSFAGKLTWQLDPQNNLVFTAFGDPTSRRAVGQTFFSAGLPVALLAPDPYLKEVEAGGVNLSLRGNHVLTQRLFVETSLARVSRSEEHLPETAQGYEPLIVDQGVWSGGSEGRVDDRSTVTTLGAKGTLFFDRHVLKAGFAYKDNALDHDQRGDILFIIDDTTYVNVVQDIRGTVHNRIPSLFAQDAWQVNERLGLNIGLRWDGQFLVGSDGKVAQKITGQFQPRLGFVLQPDASGRQKVYGSAGRFYQELSTYLLTTTFIDGAVFRFANYDHDPRVDPSGAQIFQLPGTIFPEIDGLEGQYYDEFNLGYERLVGNAVKVAVRGIRRTLGQGIENAFHPETDEVIWGNPGSGDFSAFPRMKRTYTAAEFTVQKFGGSKLNYLASYVLSRTRGNYTGLYNSDFDWAFPNAGGSYDRLENLTDATGLLPNDRTHVFKFSSSYRASRDLTLGTSLVWQSGTPLDDMTASQSGFPWMNFLRPRGTAGRTPALMDLNLRLVYDLSGHLQNRWQPRLILDLFHIGSQRDPVNIDQNHYFGIDAEGEPKNENPLYGAPTRHQPPTSLRIGFEFDF